MMWEFFSHDSIRLPLNPSLEVVGIDYKVDWLIGHGVVSHSASSSDSSDRSGNCSSSYC